MRISFLLFYGMLFPFINWGQDQISVARFREIALMPGDAVPLNQKLASAGPFWTNTIINIKLSFADGRKVEDTAEGTSKTIQGKYIVTTVRSHLSKEPIESISTYDEASSVYKVWAILGTAVTEGRIVYDISKKIYAVNSTYLDGVVELGVGSYSSVESSSCTSIFKNGVLVCTRVASTTPKKK